MDTANRKLHCIAINAPNAFNAGKKAFDDVNATLALQGFRVILIDRSNSIAQRFLRTPMVMLKLARAFFRKRSTVLVQTPLPMEVKRAIRFLIVWGRAKSILLIHDIDCLRYDDRASESEQRAEINFFRRADLIICHNTRMAAWLKTQRVFAPAVPLELFDYRISEPGSSSLPRSGSAWRGRIVFAGSLSVTKSGFIYALSNDYGAKVSVFGALPASRPALPSSVEYCGKFAPDAPTIPNGFFGLVWDGPEIRTCAGRGGEYLRINSPHKASLYLACGLPVLCWRYCAIADYIESQQLGLAIESLDEVPGLLGALSASSFEDIMGRVATATTRLRSGGYLASALARALTI